jgi:hypothetical protein
MLMLNCPLQKAEIPIGLQSTIKVLQHDNEEHTEEPENNWQKDITIIPWSPSGHPLKSKLQRTTNQLAFQQRMFKKGSNSSLFVPFEKEDQDSLDNPKELIYSIQGPSFYAWNIWDNAEPQGRMSIHPVWNEEESKKAMEKYFAKWMALTIGILANRPQECCNTDRLSCSASVCSCRGYIRVAGPQAWVSCTNEWHEVRFADELKKLAFTAGAAGAGISYVLTGGAPLIAAAGLGVSAVLDPF